MIIITDYYFVFISDAVPTKLQLRSLYFPTAAITPREHEELRAAASSVCFLCITLREGNAGTPPVFLGNDFPCSRKELC